MADHSQVVWRLDAQLNVSRPLRKNLWKQIVVAKIEAQARNLGEDQPARRKLFALARDVRSGDPTNVEAQAARVYWANWLATSDVRQLDTEPFRRDPKAAGVNSFLNYGYAVLRAAIARAIVAAGLLPSLGIHHRNRSNAFCLADDLIEPLRPLVDDRVRELWRQGYDELNQPAKAALLELLTQRVTIGEGDAAVGPLMVQLHRYVASLVRCYQGESRALNIPKPVGGVADADSSSSLTPDI
jgi:CRISPR-associated protein Cas1